MKTILSLLFFFFPLILFAQKQKVNSTDEILVSGDVKSQLKITIPDLEKLSSVAIPDVPITNHLGELKGTAKNLKGIPLKLILNDIQFKEDNPKLLSQFYLTFVALDDYKVVYSWNEIFNSPTGDNVFLVTEKEGKSLRQMPESLLIVTPTDVRTGRRYVKGLARIVVSKVN
jgi:hypothetical protein